MLGLDYVKYFRRYTLLVLFNSLHKNNSLTQVLVFKIDSPPILR